MRNAVRSTSVVIDQSLHAPPKQLRVNLSSPAHPPRHPRSHGVRKAITSFFPIAAVRDTLYHDSGTQPTNCLFKLWMDYSTFASLAIFSHHRWGEAAYFFPFFLINDVASDDVSHVAYHAGDAPWIKYYSRGFFCGGIQFSWRVWKSEATFRAVRGNVILRGEIHHHHHVQIGVAFQLGSVCAMYWKIDWFYLLAIGISHYLGKVFVLHKITYLRLFYDFKTSATTRKQCNLFAFLMFSSDVHPWKRYSR